ncbi:MAG: orotate phosphoribosyltransferase [Actinobacteria bacterium]|nr:orotate phosphoribosyltransferase [Actinomycetota bacterium]
MNDEQLRRALVEHGYIEGDFVLRSGRRSRYYLDKFRFETQPDVLEALGRRLAKAVEALEPDAARLACPVLGAVVLAASTSIASRLPFVIVRDKAKEYGTANQIEGAFEPGERVCVIEDVVTSGGALSEAVVVLREAGLECRTAICVVDREEGGVDALARLGVRLEPLFVASSLLELRKDAAKPHG